MHARYFTPYEVAQHNSPTDCWVSVFNTVYDLTSLLKTNDGSEVQVIIENAGKDVSHWFDVSTQDVRSRICIDSGRRVPYCPQGRFLHVPPSYPCSKFSMEFHTPWWKDVKYQIGRLTKCARVVRFKNVLTGQDDKMEVPEEETISEIRKRYLVLNCHAHSYSIKGFSKDNKGEWNLKELDLGETLTDNGIPNEAQRFETSSLASDMYTPVLMMYWNDELTTL